MRSFLIDLHRRMVGAFRQDGVIRREEGQGLAEYALILFFIAVVAVASLTLLGGKISLLLSEVATSL
jgi:Flp pilus assembly pilin Flp